MPCASALPSGVLPLGTQPPYCEEAQRSPCRHHMERPCVGVPADSQCQSPDVGVNMPSGIPAPRCQVTPAEALDIVESSHFHCAPSEFRSSRTCEQNKTVVLYHRVWGGLFWSISNEKEIEKENVRMRMNKDGKRHSLQMKRLTLLSSLAPHPPHLLSWEHEA